MLPKPCFSVNRQQLHVQLAQACNMRIGGSSIFSVLRDVVMDQDQLLQTVVTLKKKDFLSNKAKLHVHS